LQGGGHGQRVSAADQWTVQDAGQPSQQIAAQSLRYAGRGALEAKNST